MFCIHCGKEVIDGATFCNSCGKPTNASTPTVENGQDTVPIYRATVQEKQEKSGKSIASLVLGIFGLFAWLIPLLGFPVTIVGLILGISGSKKGSRGIAIAGIVICIITLVLTIINSAIGAYLGANGQLWFQ